MTRRWVGLRRMAVLRARHVERAVFLGTRGLLRAGCLVVFPAMGVRDGVFVASTMEVRERR